MNAMGGMGGGKQPYQPQQQTFDDSERELLARLLMERG